MVQLGRMNTRVENDGGIRSVSRGIAVLQAINRFGSLTLSEIADQLELPHPTVTRILRTLQEQGLIERLPSQRNKYRPTALVQTLSYGYQNSDRLVTCARPHIVELTNKVGWPVSIATRVGKAMVVRDSTSSITTLTFNNYYPGWQVPLLTSASGKVFLAYADADAKKLLLSPLDCMERERVAAECEKIRADGYAAVARTQYSLNPGMTSSVAVPLFEGKTHLGSLALVFFARAMSLEDAVARFVRPLRETARHIGEDMERDSMAARNAARNKAGARITARP
jgi:IclR family mhp operon transcriptional activator